MDFKILILQIINESIVELTREIEKGLIQPSLSNLNLIKKSNVN